MNLLAAAFFLLTPIPILVFYYFRSTKEFPKSWKEFSIEVRTIWCGVRSQNEDIVLRKRNRIKLQSLHNKIAVITGGNRGIGLHIVKKLLRCEMKVVMGVRNPESSRKSVETTIGEELCRNNITYFQCDTGDMESVRQFATKVKQSFPAIHVLINNAGVMSTPYYKTKDGFESQMAINYLGHFLLTHLLLPELIKGSETNDGKNVRVVNVTSCVHRVADKIDYEDFDCTKFYYPIDAYAKSKLAQVYFTKYLEVIFKERGLKIQSHAPHPGIVNTDLFQNSKNTDVKWFKDIFYKTPESGSRTIVYAAISPYLEGKGGTYLNNCYFDKSHPKSKDFNEIKKLFDFTCQLLNIKSFGEF